VQALQIGSHHALPPTHSFLANASTPGPTTMAHEADWQISTLEPRQPPVQAKALSTFVVALRRPGAFPDKEVGTGGVCAMRTIVQKTTL
jgi:hypothetical protein